MLPIEQQEPHHSPGAVVAAAATQLVPTQLEFFDPHTNRQQSSADAKMMKSQPLKVACFLSRLIALKSGRCGSELC